MRSHHALTKTSLRLSLCLSLCSSFAFITACGAPAEGDPDSSGADPVGGDEGPGATGDDDGARPPFGSRDGVLDPAEGPKPNTGDTGSGSDPGDDVGSGDPETPPVVGGPETPVEPPVVPGEIGDPTAPHLDGGTALPWPEAPPLEGVLVQRNRDSVTLHVPAVEGAQDYRAFVLRDGVGLEVEGDGAERVLDATVHCAGHEQHNAPATEPRVPVRELEVTDIRGPVRVVVEALDTACPFPGVVGKEHADIDVTNYALGGADRVPFSIYTEDEVRERYGSLIVGGHRPGAQLGAPASDTAPRVLARTTLAVSPKTGAPPTSDFFAGFSDDDDQPAYVGELPPHGRVPMAGQLFENSQLTFTTYAMEHAQVFVDRGQLHVLLADWEQDVFASAVAYPKRAAAMSGEDYVHVTFEVPSNATARRYWWLSMCGADAPGETIDDDGRLLGDIVQTPFFYQNDGKNPSVEKWSCLQLFPRDGLPTPLPPTDRRPESDLRVMVNVPNAGERDSVRNVSPSQYPHGGSAGWFRQMDAQGELVAPILDDQLFVTQKTRYDVYVRDDRVIVYVDGEQRLCNDFPGTPLTMAEAAVGFGQVLYHSAAERVEFSRSFNDRTGQRYYLENTPYIDVRAWDNLGFDDGVDAPASFDESLCYVHAG